MQPYTFKDEVDRGIHAATTDPYGRRQRMEEGKNCFDNIHSVWEPLQGIVGDEEANRIIYNGIVRVQRNQEIDAPKTNTINALDQLDKGMLLVNRFWTNSRIEMEVALTVILLSCGYHVKISTPSTTTADKIAQKFSKMYPKKDHKDLSVLRVTPSPREIYNDQKKNPSKDTWLFGGDSDEDPQLKLLEELKVQYYLWTVRQKWGFIDDPDHVMAHIFDHVEKKDRPLEWRYWKHSDTEASGKEFFGDKVDMYEEIGKYLQKTIGTRISTFEAEDCLRFEQVSPTISHGWDQTDLLLGLRDVSRRHHPKCSLDYFRRSRHALTVDHCQLRQG